jgi:UDP-N-acetylglucosamine:LPS N-acetylglucosamine transferase
LSTLDKLNQQSTVLLAIYGQGGHRAEMRKLIQHLREGNSKLKVVTLGNGEIEDVVAHFAAKDIRDKHNRIVTLLLFLPVLLSTLLNIIRICRHYNINGVLSTGPGLCILPMLMMRLMGYKTVFVETYCRFNSLSMTGRVMYKIAHRFLIQNKQLQTLYPNGQYCGRV